MTAQLLSSVDKAYLSTELETHIKSNVSLIEQYFTQTAAVLV